MNILKTKRLLLREVSTDDADFILKLINEPAWHEFIYNHSTDTIEKASDYIEQKMIAMYQKLGFGLWIVEKIQNAEPIGICGLLKRDTLNCIDLGFAFSADYWGQGFASEASIGALIYARNKLKAQRVIAITDPLNTRSVKLLEKIGFVYESKFSHPGSDEILSLYAKT